MEATAGAAAVKFTVAAVVAPPETNAGVSDVEISLVRATEAAFGTNAGAADVEIVVARAVAMEATAGAAAVKFTVAAVVAPPETNAGVSDVEISSLLVLASLDTLASEALWARSPSATLSSGDSGSTSASSSSAPSSPFSCPTLNRALCCKASCAPSRANPCPNSFEALVPYASFMLPNECENGFTRPPCRPSRCI